MKKTSKKFVRETYLEIIGAKQLHVLDVPPHKTQLWLNFP